MFETVSTEAVIGRHRKLWYETLPVSLVVHVVAVAAVVGGSAFRSVFPSEPPHLMFAYSVADLNLTPPPPPPPPPPPRAQIDAPKITQAPVPPEQIVAPTIIPDTIPDVQPPVYTAADIATPKTDEPSSAPGGVPGGDPAGVAGGVVGGQPQGILGGVLEADGRVHFARNTALPLYIERQEYPTYPEELRNRGLEDEVVVRYTIDKKGRVKDLTIIAHAQHKEFDLAAADAINAWRFRPFVVDGETREVVHELAVLFRLR